MNKTFQVIKHEFTHMVKTKGFIIITLLFPMLAFIALGVYQVIQTTGAGDKTAEVLTVGYVDEVGGFVSTGQTEGMIFIDYQNQVEATEALLAGDINEYFVIPADYINSGRIDRFTLEREMETPGSTASAIRGLLLDNMLQGQINEEVVERAKAPAWFNTTRLDETGQMSPEQGGVLGVFLVPYVFSLLFWIAVLTASFTLIEGLGEEKENRIMEILVSSVSTRQLILGKIIGLGAAGLLQILLWFVSARFVVELASASIGGMFGTLEIPMRLLALGIAYFILGYILFAVMFAVIGAIVPTYREGQQLSFFIIMPGIAPLMLIYFVVENPEHLITQIVTFFPISAPIASMIRLAVGNLPPWQIALNMFLLVISIIGLFLLGAKIFRSFLLMYGKRPSPREIIRSLRQA